MELAIVFLGIAVFAHALLGQKPTIKNLPVDPIRQQEAWALEGAAARRAGVNRNPYVFPPEYGTADWTENWHAAVFWWDGYYADPIIRRDIAA